MVTPEDLKAYLAHVVAFLVIIPFIILLCLSAFKEIRIPEILISLGSGAIGYYLSYIKK